MERHSNKSVWAFISLVCVAGLLLSFVSILHFVEFKYGLKQEASFCNINEQFNCDAVTASPHSVLFGIPIASYGFFFYLCLLVLSVGRGAEKYGGRKLTSFFFLCANFSILFSVYLFFVSKYLIGVLCPTCIALYVVNISILVGSWLLVKEIGYLAALGAGFSSALTFLGSIRSTATARRFLIAVLLFALGTLSLPRFMGSYLTSLRAGQRVTNSSYSELVNRWRATGFDDLPLKLKGSVLERDFSKGPANAPIQVVEFADFECPACQHAFSVVHDILKDYPNKVHFIFKNFPLDKACNEELPRELHQHACKAAYFARCAGEQGKYWEAAEELFMLKELDSRTPASVVNNELDRVASNLGLDGQAIWECVRSERHKPKIQADIKVALEHGIESTPTFWVNGKRLDRLQVNDLREIFDHILESNNPPLK